MTNKSALSKTLNKIAARANRKAFNALNAKRKAMGLPLLKFNPSRTYWI